MPDKAHVTIYTDGSVSPNPGFGGWGVVLIADNGTTKELSGGECDTTNNRMELLAAIQAFRALRKPCIVDIHTDSQYVQQGITKWLPGWIRKNWRTSGKEDVKNKDLWLALQAESQQHEVRWHWVRGHNGDANNERADVLAEQGRLSALETYKKLQNSDGRE
jgi:ribonuclease HI